MRAAFLGLALLLSGCGGPQFYPPDAYPQRLSEWGLIELEGTVLASDGGAISYGLNTPLFSNYALKFRAVHLPPGATLRYAKDGAIAAPVGTVVSKTFFYPRDGKEAGAVSRHSSWDGAIGAIDRAQYRLVETRLLVRQRHGWDALPYVWQGNDAILDLTGELIAMQLDGEAFAYVVPSRNECGSCHVTDHSSGELRPIGLQARHLPEATLRTLAQAGQLVGLPSVVSQNAAAHAWADPDAAARAYLDINCGHCHSPTGAADTSGLLLDLAGARTLRQNGVCKPPIAAGRGSGDRRFSIVPGAPDASILLYRMETNAADQRMPEVGRAVVHEEGVALIREWIAGLPGAC